MNLDIRHQKVDSKPAVSIAIDVARIITSYRGSDRNIIAVFEVDDYICGLLAVESLCTIIDHQYMFLQPIQLDCNQIVTITVSCKRAAILVVPSTLVVYNFVKSNTTITIACTILTGRTSQESNCPCTCKILLK